MTFETEAARYAFNVFAVPPALTALAVFLFGAVVAWRERGSRQGALFALVTTLIATWLTSFAVGLCATDEESALTATRLAYLAIPLIPAAVFHFTSVVLGDWRRSRHAAIAAWVLAAVFLGFNATTELFFDGARYYRWGYYPLLGGWSVPFLVYVAGFLVWSVVRYVVARRQTRDHREKQRLLGLLTGFSIGLLALVDFLPSFNVPVYPFGYLPVLAFIVVTGRTIRRLDLMPITPEFAAAEILETMQGAVLVCDLKGSIRLVNRAFCRMLGYAEEELLGHPMERFVQSPFEIGARSSMYRSSWAVRDRAQTWKTKDAREVEVVVSASVVKNGRGVPSGVVYVAADMTERKRMEDALKQSERDYRGLFENAHDAILILDPETEKVLDANSHACALYGYPAEELIGRSILPMSRSPESGKHHVKRLLEHGRNHHFETVQFRKDGTPMHLDINSSLVDFKGKIAILSVNRDVTDRKRAELALQKSEERYRTLIARNLAGVYRTTPDGRILDCNDACARIFGYSTREELLAQSAPNVYYEAGERESLLQRLRMHGSLTNLEARMKRKDGSAVWVLENVSLALDDEGNEILEGTVIDITDRKANEQRIEFQAFHDSLTGLPNRNLFLDRMHVALGQARRAHRPLAVMYLDLDGFKSINDTLGHAVGDALLRAVAGRLADCVRREDTVARLGGDEFVLLLGQLTDPQDAVRIAEKVLASVAETISVEGHELHVTTSLGIALYPEDGEEPETLLKNADAAMYRAKQTGRNRYQLCTPEMNRRAMQRLMIERELRSALEGSELEMFYQPVVDLRTGQAVGAEALLRWRHPERGLLDPGEFLAAAEEARLSPQIGEWALARAVEQIAEWRDKGLPVGWISVNVGARHLFTREFASSVREHLERWSVDGSSLLIEVPEEAAASDPDACLAITRSLAALGVGVVIDDCGGGGMPLMLLERARPNRMKIDQRLVARAGDGDAAAVIEVIVGIASRLGIRAVAEGIETEEQLTAMRSAGCAEAQGYLWCRPVAPEGIEAFLARA